MDTKSLQLYINAGVEFRSIVGLEAGSIVFIPPGWHVWCQNGSTGGSAACKDLTQIEYHCIPAGSLTQSSMALENLKSQLELMEPSCESEVQARDQDRYYRTNLSPDAREKGSAFGNFPYTSRRASRWHRIFTTCFTDSALLHRFGFTISRNASGDSGPGIHLLLNVYDWSH